MYCVSVMKTVGNTGKKAIRACAIDVQNTWVSNYRCLILVIGQPHDCTPTIIGQGFGDIQNNQGQGKVYQLKPKA